MAFVARRLFSTSRIIAGGGGTIRYIHWNDRVLEPEKILSVSKSKRWFYWSYPHRVTIAYAERQPPTYVGNEVVKFPVYSETTYISRKYKNEADADADIVVLRGD